MDLQTLKKDISHRSKNGLPFLLAAAVVWTIVTIIFTFDSLAVTVQNILMLFAAATTFPFALLFAALTKTDWQLKGNPLGALGLLFNLGQFLYFPILLWAFAERPEVAVTFFAIITGAHLLPYGWLYNSAAYYIMSPLVAVGAFLVGWAATDTVWILPVFMASCMVILSGLLYSGSTKK